MSAMLTIEDHRRDAAGLLYVYPVISRRAGGVSVGINLNVNNACNWACVYCQVENLSKGGPPPLDQERLATELTAFLHQAIDGDFMLRQVPEGARRLVDVAFSGNGEPTSAAEFKAAVERVQAVLAQFGLLGKLPVRLITNGSLLHRPLVQEGVRRLGQMGGEVWFKLDRADTAGMLQVNGVNDQPQRVQERLRCCAGLAPTWVQTCWFGMDGEVPSAHALSLYCDLLLPLAPLLAGVHLYGLARPSCQPAANRLHRLDADQLQAIAVDIQNKTGIRVMVSP